ncbi:hypothetical protein RUM44_008603 [Polyplax serrata]|uniref:Large ribosomal subunit protein mL50 n=1 Tax=Polyplax serrata TaxID=468196 RepID=A0ABR1BAV5_POLSC
MSTTRKRLKEKKHSKMVKKESEDVDKFGTPKNRYLISSACESLSARGFLRSYKSYTPPENASERVIEIAKVVLGTNYQNEDHLKHNDKFALLNECFKEFNHCVPNSLLHTVTGVADIINFYETPVNTNVPYDELVKQDLPPNLNIQHDYIRFNPETDTLFKGISAFPQSSTIVTGLKTKKKYKGYKADPPENYGGTADFEKQNPYN